MYFGMRPSSIRRTWPNPRSLRCISRVTYWEDQHETGHQRRLLCPARICPGYGGCFSDGTCWTYSPARHMYFMSRCHTAMCWYHRQCRLPYLSSQAAWALSTLEPCDERELKLPSQSSCRSLRPKRGCRWLWSRGRWTCRQHRVRNREC